MSPTAVPSGKLGFSSSICSAKGLPGGNPSLEGETQLGRATDTAPITAMTTQMIHASLKVENRTLSPAYWFLLGVAIMNDLTCMIQGCQARVYSPAGTQHVCKEHFLSFLTWRRRKGQQMFIHYAGLTMEQRDPIAVEWSKTVTVIEGAAGATQKP
jgi:hypothetical protein